MDKDFISSKSPWFVDVPNYLTTKKLPKNFSPHEKNKVIKQSDRYSWVKGYLFYIRLDLIIGRCVREDDFFDILKSCHDEPCGGNFADKRTTYKFLCLEYYWPKMFRDAKKYVISSDSFH